MKMIKWNQKVQKQGRIKIPVEYLDSFNIKEGDTAILEQTKKDKTLIIKFGKAA